MKKKRVGLALALASGWGLPTVGVCYQFATALAGHCVTTADFIYYLDVLPLTASKTEALRYVALRWQLPIEAILVEASQQGDGELLRGLSLGVVPEDHDPALEGLRSHRRVYFSSRPQAWGLLDGLEHHRFLRRSLTA
jgi:hydroxymethylpyrimidine pyrophosphatase-like HAD family hydrolase